MAKASTRLITKLLKQFTKQDIPYVIIRNYEFLTQKSKTVGKDLDVIIRKKHARKITELMLDQGFTKQPISPFSHHIGFAYYLPKEQKLVKFHFHVGGLSGTFLTYLSAKQVLRRAKKKKWFFVMSDEDNLLAALLHGGMSPNQKVKEKYRKTLVSCVKKKLDWMYIEKELKRLLGKSLAEDLMGVSQKNKFDDLTSFRRRKRNGLLIRHPFNLIYTIYVLGMSSLWHGLRRLKPAPLITFIGMDGAGKTTATTKLVEMLQQNQLPASLVYTGRGKDNILPIQFFGRKYKAVEKKHDAKKEKRAERKKHIYPEINLKKSSFLRKTMYTLAAPVFAADLYLRYLVHIFPKRHKNIIVITDRYSSDLLIMKNVHESLRRFLYWFFPKPSLTIYLYNKPKVLYKRKPGHPKGDLERQQLLFSYLLPKLNPHKIKSVSINQVLHDVGKKAFERILEAWK